ncbi:hypothetical protein D3C72_2278040 [compost metagenome]
MPPSAFAFSTFDAAIVPVAPPRFSTTTRAPRLSPMGPLRMRALTSLGPPAGYGTIMLTGPLG